jgi:hypothetical protein
MSAYSATMVDPVNGADLFVTEARMGATGPNGNRAVIPIGVSARRNARSVDRMATAEVAEDDKRRRPPLDHRP